MEKSYILVSLEDDKAKHIAEVMSNKTCKKILGLLAEKEMSESDIAKESGLALNTAEYNLKKLVSANLVEKSKSFFWSVKGKKIPVYKLSNKYIVIAPKNSKFSGLKTFVPVLVILGAGALLVNYFSRISQSARDFSAPLMSGAKSAELTNAVSTTGLNWVTSTPWAVFLAGGIIALIAYFCFRKIFERRSNK